jgi:phosphoenolpyruvate synthase/pyruvate phosphate dikinase
MLKNTLNAKEINVITFQNINKTKLRIVGGKGANLGDSSTTNIR